LEKIRHDKLSRSRKMIYHALRENLRGYLREDRRLAWGPGWRLLKHPKVRGSRSKNCEDLRTTGTIEGAIGTNAAAPSLKEDRCVEAIEKKKDGEHRGLSWKRRRSFQKEEK